MSYGSIVVESTEKLDYYAAIELGVTIEEPHVRIGGEHLSIDELYRVNTEHFATVYPIKGDNKGEVSAVAPIAA